jgi:hypothetical protein
VTIAALALAVLALLLHLQDVMSPTGAPWASSSTALKPAKPPPRLVEAPPALPPPALEIPGVAELARPTTAAGSAAGASSTQQGDGSQVQGGPVAPGTPETGGQSQGAGGPSSDVHAVGSSGAALAAGPSSTGSSAEGPSSISGAPTAEAAHGAGASGSSAPYPARKAIMNAADLTRFLESESARSFMSYLLALNEACAGKKVRAGCRAAIAAQLGKTAAAAVPGLTVQSNAIPMHPADYVL